MKKIFFFAILLVLLFCKTNVKASNYTGTANNLTPVSDSLPVKNNSVKSNHKNKFKNFTGTAVKFFTLVVLSSHVNADCNHSAPASLLINNPTK